MPLVTLIWLSIVSKTPVASFLVCSRLKASTGRCAPAWSLSSTGGKLSSGMVKITVIGSSWVMTAIPVVSVAWTMLPGSTNRRPMRPLTGAVMCV